MNKSFTPLCTVDVYSKRLRCSDSEGPDKWFKRIYGMKKKRKKKMRSCARDPDLGVQREFSQEAYAVCATSKNWTAWLTSRF